MGAFAYLMGSIKSTVHNVPLIKQGTRRLRYEMFQLSSGWHCIHVVELHRFLLFFNILSVLIKDSNSHSFYHLHLIPPWFNLHACVQLMLLVTGKNIITFWWEAMLVCEEASSQKCFLSWAMQSGWNWWINITFFCCKKYSVKVVCINHQQITSLIF